jgi:hypothetical protein
VPPLTKAEDPKVPQAHFDLSIEETNIEWRQCRIMLAGALTVQGRNMAFLNIRIQKRRLLAWWKAPRSGQEKETGQSFREAFPAGTIRATSSWQTNAAVSKWLY